jgi:hypothetical protein
MWRRLTAKGALEHPWMTSKASDKNLEGQSWLSHTPSRFTKMTNLGFAHGFRGKTRTSPLPVAAAVP